VPQTGPAGTARGWIERFHVSHCDVLAWDGMRDTVIVKATADSEAMDRFKALGVDAHE
jgi:hypothetical protein